MGLLLLYFHKMMQEDRYFLHHIGNTVHDELPKSDENAR